MIRCEVLDVFTLRRFDELKNIKRKNADVYGKLFKGDEFECSQEIADYLLKDNSYNKPFVRVLEIIPEKIEMPIVGSTGEECVVPLDEENMNRVAKKIIKYIEVNEKPNKKKTSKK